jgi:dTDP-4-dehydrorhamnose 3,5-epimerase-like enzyme
MLYVPKGFAHGYQALQDDTEPMYMVGEFYT